MLSLICADLYNLARGLVLPCQGPGRLPCLQLWDEEEEEGVVDIQIMSATEPIDEKDPMVKMEDIFEEIGGVNKDGLRRSCHGGED